MGFSSLKARVSFQAKVLVPVVTVMVLLIAAAMWVVNLRISTQVRTEAAQQLEMANAVFTNTQVMRTDSLVTRYQSVIGESSFKATLTQTDSATISNHLADIVNADGDASVVLFTPDDGKQIAGITTNEERQLNASEFEAACSASIHRAAAGEANSEIVLVSNRLYEVISLQSYQGVTTFGILMGDDVARQIKKFTRSEILFLSGSVVVASSLERPDFNGQLVAKYHELTGGLETAKGGAAARMVLGKENFVCKAGSFSSAGGGSGPGYLLLSSIEEPLAVLRSTQQNFLAVSLLGILASTAVVWFLIGRVTRPLRQLRDSAEAVGRGDFSKRVEVNSQDECGELAAVFNRMTENLETSRQELEKTVTTLKNTQHQLIQSEKLSGIGEFVAGVAHELNNPLTSVMGFAELLQQSDMPEQQRRYLDVIFKSAKRCQKIVSSLLSFARRHAPERKVVCVNEIVESAVEILHYQMRTSNIEVITELDPNLPATEVDSHQMQQVFLNLINNARQAMEAFQNKGQLRVKTESAGDRVRISFRDNGPGIPAENLKKIFNPFFTTKEVGKGTGLGLSLCYGIVSEHGGTVTPFSKEGEGATFVVELPVSRLAATEAEKKATVPLPAQTATREGVGKRVLVIDDEDSILQMIREVLMRNGYRVDIARDGEAGLQRLNQYHYDLALCDWKMPGLNGQQIFEKLSATNPDMSRRLIFITGDVVNEKTQDFLKAQHKVCLSKPFTLMEFRSAVSRVITTAG